MNHEQPLTVRCRECATPVEIKCPQLDVIRFPADDKKIVQLLSGRLHVHQCPACSTKTPVFVPLMVVHEDMTRVLAAVPQSVADETRRSLAASADKIGHEMQVIVCNNYVELYAALAPWINEILMPFLQTLLARENAERKIEPDQITPLILMLFHGQAQGTIEPFIRMEQGGRPVDGRNLMRKIHIAMVTDVLTDLRRKVVRSKTLPQLEDAIRNRVPVECVIDEVLEDSRSACPAEVVDPMEHPADFVKAFLGEYSNAVLHAYADRENPRALQWASCLRVIWWLGKRSDTTLDPQFRLPAAVIRRTARFSDLWNLYGRDPTDNLDALQAHISDRHEMMEAYGFAQDESMALRSGMIRINVTVGKPQEAQDAMEAIGNTFLDLFGKRMPLNASEEDSEAYGEAVGAQIRVFAKNGRIEVGKQVGKAALERAIQAKDSIAAITTATSSIEALNLFGEHLAAAEFAHRILEDLDDLTAGAARVGEPWRLLLDLFNESGNVFRYLRHFDESLGSYRICETLIDKIPDANDRPRLWAILRKNQAIVYREMGRYRQARELFEKQIAAKPDDEALLNSAAVLACETGDYEVARRYIDRALDVTENRVLPEDRAALFLTQGVIRLALADAAGGIEDLAKAFADSQPGAQQIAIRAACVIVRHPTATQPHSEFVQTCVKWLQERLKEDACRSNPSRMALIVITLAEHEMAAGRTKEVELRLHKELAWLDRHTAQMPWQYHIARSRMHHELASFKLAASHLSAAIRSINSDVPTGEEAAFALGWMRDKRVFQDMLGQLATDLSDRGFLSGDQLLEVYELLNGREISARLEDESDSRSIAERLGSYLAKIDRKLVVFWFLEVGDRVRLGYLSGDVVSPKLLKGCAFTQSEIEVVKLRLRETVNTLGRESLTYQADRLRSWDDLAATLGRVIGPVLTPGCQVCFLPGRTFTGLPLHLLTLPDGRALIEDHPILYAPNFAVMLSETPTLGDKRKLTALVTVTIQGDSDEFKRRARETSEELFSMLGGTDRVLSLSEEAADRAAVLATFPQASEIIFLCHGTNAGPKKGFGICIASRGELPPGLFPIERVPELSRFLICWDDLEAVGAAPALVVSIACSSGLAVIGHSGTRHGLEQTLFAKGTRVIASPLWDVDQEAALNWLKAFTEIRKSRTVRSLTEAHRMACLRVRAMNPHLHPTSWGAFVVNGSLFT